MRLRFGPKTTSGFLCKPLSPGLMAASQTCAILHELLPLLLLPGLLITLLTLHIAQNYNNIAGYPPFMAYIASYSLKYGPIMVMVKK